MTSGPARDEPDVIIANEFASVRVSRDTAGSSPRLRIEDLRTRRVFYLDALELEGLAWATHEDLRQFVDPSASRWASREGSS
jgi:hypothetical protein